MVYIYVLDKEDYSNIDFNDNDIQVEALHDNYNIYQDLLKIHSNIELDLDPNDIYTIFKLVANDRELNDNTLKFYQDLLEKESGYKHIESRIESTGSSKYINFYSHTMPIYIKNKMKQTLLKKINQFQGCYYGRGKTVAQQLKEEGISSRNISDLYYGKEIKTLPESKKIVSDKKLNLYIPLKADENYYYYQDLEDLKNINRIENNNLAKHKLLKKDKFLLSSILAENNLVHNIKDYNQLLADNEIVYQDGAHLKKQSQQFYQQAQKSNKKIFNNLDQALCFMLSFSLQNEEVLLISEKDQWIVYYHQMPANIDNFNCRQAILDKLKDKNFNTSSVENLSLSKLANLFIVNQQLFISDENNPVFLDNEGANLPLYIVSNHGLHYHNYYENGLWDSLLKKEHFKEVLPDLVDFHFISTDNHNHVEVSAYYQGRDKIIDKNFYLPSQYQDIINHKLKKLFTLGLMTSSYSVVKWQKENLFDIKEVSMPDWIKNIDDSKEKELFKYLLQF